MFQNFVLMSSRNFFSVNLTSNSNADILVLNITFYYNEKQISVFNHDKS